MNRPKWRAFVALMAIMVLAAMCARAAEAEVAFAAESLQGTYAYVNTAGDVASFGLITFDGAGKLTAAIKVNGPDESGGRRINALTATGTYTVDAAGMGVATIQFKGVGVEQQGIYDFVITEVAKEKKGRHALATAVFAAQQTGGLHGQLVAPVWTRRSD
jgi:hypothetical protein